MNLRYCFLFLVAFISVRASAKGTDPAAYCADNKSKLFRTTKTTIADTGEDAYDIKYVKFNINLTDSSTAVSGDVTTIAKVTAASLDTFVFELNDTLSVDSIKVNGVSSNLLTSGVVRKVPLNTALPAGATFSVQVYYHGISPAGTGFFTHGLNQSVLPSGTHIMYTCSDPDWASDWWPCKQSIDDKIDSVDMYVTVPPGTKAGSNGLLKAVQLLPGGYQQFHWQTIYPIDYYLISVSVAPYIDYSYYMHFTGSTDSMLVQNYFYDTATFMPLYKKNFDSTGLMIDYLSTLYGRYPFYKEKYGHCFSNLGGGMEHQTMTTMGETTTPLIAHELGHQWFGDCVTYASWRDIWLSEGFASYTEQLFIEHFWGVSAAYFYRTLRYNTVMNTPTGSLYVDDTTSVARIFDTRLTYYKGAAVAHMLRFMAPEDSLFFRALRIYQQTYRFGLATTENLKNVFSSVYGISLDTFFNQWVYGQGYPIYTVKWNQSGNKVYVQLNQTPAPATSPIFVTPVEILLKSAAGDTLVKVYNNLATQTYSFTWDRTMTGLAVDPNNWILDRTTSITRDSKLSVTSTLLQVPHVYPNPAKDYWQIGQLPTGTEMVLADVKGKIIWRGRSNSTVTIIPGNNLAAGTYILSFPEDSGYTSVRLVHW